MASTGGPEGGTDPLLPSVMSGTAGRRDHLLWPLPSPVDHSGASQQVSA